MKTYIKGYDAKPDSAIEGEHPPLGITEVTDSVPTHINKIIVHGDEELRALIIERLNPTEGPSYG